MSIKANRLLAILILAVLIIFISVITIASFHKKGSSYKKQLFLPGTQPLEIKGFEPAKKCQICHQPFSYQTAPFTKWQGSMMAQAARDPIFNAALSIEEQNFQKVGYFCLRCHSPINWLLGRSKLSEISNLKPEEVTGVTCDFCHHLLDPLATNSEQRHKKKVLTYGNGMYLVSEELQVKYGPYRQIPTSHKAAYSPFYQSSNFCGTCHEVTNPVNKLPLQRTYSEWKNSWYATQGYQGSCQSCHMKAVSGYAANPRSITEAVPYRTPLASHDLTGGSNWIYDGLSLLWPELNKKSLELGKQRAIENLKRAASLELGAEKFADKVEAKVRVYNLTGHKLPTGYPLGRRMWINIKAFDENGQLVFESGHYQPDTGKLAKDKQLKVYQAKLAKKGKGNTFHYFQANYISIDNRIPPKGFTNENFNKAGAGVTGYQYSDGQFWDDTIYNLPKTTKTIKVSLLYQSTSAKYIKFLKDKNRSNNWGDKLWRVWKQTGNSRPIEIANLSFEIPG
jgi:hypothetical protein